MLGADPTKVSLRAKKRGLPQARLSRPSTLFIKVLTVLLNVRLTPADACQQRRQKIPCCNPCTCAPSASGSLCQRELLEHWFSAEYSAQLTVWAADGHAGRGEPLRGDPGGGSGL